MFNKATVIKKLMIEKQLEVKGGLFESCSKIQIVKHAGNCFSESPVFFGLIDYKIK